MAKYAVSQHAGEYPHIIIDITDDEAAWLLRDLEGTPVGGAYESAIRRLLATTEKWDDFPRLRRKLYGHTE